MTDAEKMTALITAATNARNVLLMNLDLFEGEESSDHRDGEEEATSVGNALSDALKPFEMKMDNHATSRVDTEEC